MESTKVPTKEGSVGIFRFREVCRQIPLVPVLVIMDDDVESARRALGADPSDRPRWPCRYWVHAHLAW
jgi:hypothetical protein